jgi:hypothetical protein
MLQFTAKAIKATLVLNATAVAATDVVGDTAVFTMPWATRRSPASSTPRRSVGWSRWCQSTVPTLSPSWLKGSS